MYRHEVAAEMRQAGMSIRAIAYQLGVSPATVHADLKLSKLLNPTAVQNQTPDEVFGLDGKTYRSANTRPLPQKPALASLPNQLTKLIRKELVHTRTLCLPTDELCERLREIADDLEGVALRIRSFADGAAAARGEG